jgi:hypothetical protein
MGTLLLGDGRYGFDVRPVLIGWCALLLAFAIWLNHVLFGNTRRLHAFVVAIGSVLLVWLWQWVALGALVPGRSLTWGYFLTPEGAKAGFWVLDFRFWFGVVRLSISCAIALVIGWRQGFLKTRRCRAR